MKAKIPRLKGIEVNVCRLDLDRGYIEWYDNQKKRKPGSRMAFEFELLEDIDIIQGDPSTKYHCRLIEKCSKVNSCLRIEGRC